ncbi:MAG: Dam family site-specific DNA-(adenine-N6)-methyltransferase [Anaerolineae bacterium]|jgi:DNA adenine methylase|nr:Dam family site-specific DNA-(adenine-N6)-methyltransferase [Anaerolineae bacterium]
MHTPPLKWAGGKRWLIPHLAPLWQPYSHLRLVEPFCGGLGVALSLNPARALLNDINPHLINLYQWMQKGIPHIGLSQADNDEATFYAKRDQLNNAIRQNNAKTAESAVLFYYLNRTCYNGLCRFNRKGLFNVPFGAYKHIPYMTEAEFAGYKPVFARWQFTCGDFASLQIADDDFLYIDPPYDVPFTSYAKEDFTWDDQRRLVSWLSDYKNPMVVSNQATPRMIKLYEGAGFEITYLSAPRRISNNGDRTPAQEMLAYKNIAVQLTPSAGRQLSLFEG